MWLNERVGMNAEAHNTILFVFRDAARVPHFFDLSDSERMNWLILRAYELGQRSKSPKKRSKKVRKSRA